MAQLVFNIPDAEVPRIQAAFIAHPEFVASGLTEAQWARQSVMNYVKQVVKQYEIQQARIAASNTVTEINPN